jgi:hypothetical protein
MKNNSIEHHVNLLVADHVMEWVLLKGEVDPLLHDSEGSIWTLGGSCLCHGEFDPVANPAATAMVVEAVARRLDIGPKFGFMIELFEGLWCATFYDHDKGEVGTGDARTPGLATCNASLDWLGIETPAPDPVVGNLIPAEAM